MSPNLSKVVSCDATSAEALSGFTCAWVACENTWLACRGQQSQARTLMLCLVLDWSVTQLTPWTSAAASLSGAASLCVHAACNKFAT